MLGSSFLSLWQSRFFPYANYVTQFCFRLSKYDPVVLYLSLCEFRLDLLLFCLFISSSDELFHLSEHAIYLRILL